MSKLGIIGLGRVGSQILTDVQREQLFKEIVLIDENEKLARGEALDHHHVTGANGTPRVKIYAGSYDDLKDADLVIITASIVTEANMADRVALAKGNKKIIEDVIKNIESVTKEAIILNVSNPVDTITYIGSKHYDKKKIIGTGTMLETARFKTLISDHYDIDPKSIDAFVIGEHGKHAVPVWSKVRIFGMDLEEFERLAGKPSIDKDKVTESIDQLAFEVFSNKGWTNSAISRITVDLAKSVVFDEKSIYSVTSESNEYGYKEVAYGLPTIIGKDGIEQRLEIELSDDEQSALTEAVEYIKQTIEL